MYADYELRVLPLSLKSTRMSVERFLSSCGLRLDDVDHYAVITPLDDDRILAGGGLKGNVVKCLAVTDELRGTGMMQRLVSHLISTAQAEGHENVKVFTKPENEDLFKSLGFNLLAQAPQAILMENGQRGLQNYLAYLRGISKPGRNGVIVMNANPFTLGHQALVERASQQVDHLYVIAVKEDCSEFTYAERRAMIEAGCAHLPNVTVCDGSDYAISAATFPTYFLKRIEQATDTQITLDLDLFARHIAPALNCAIRFVGNEPNDPLTARYVELMSQILPQRGIQVDVMPRFCQDGTPVSASVVRKRLDEGNFASAASMVPSSTLPYLIAYSAHRALVVELETTPKPGLVDLNDNGSHTDMNEALMRSSIRALRPHFVKLALMGMSDAVPTTSAIKEEGLAAENDMLGATGGVNTHRGALFALGLMVIASAHLAYQSLPVISVALSRSIAAIACGFQPVANSHGGRATQTYNAKGALQMAQQGYEPLFAEWLPFFRSLTGDANRDLKTLLCIMAKLDDTNVLHRCGSEIASQVKQKTQQILEHFSLESLEALNRQFIEQNISPGGVADMFALTILADSITKK